ncbi:MAG: HAD-IA family hydrolase [Propioniciclava sp.]|uniref:HAD-IA family hydrolase n=1 Tax=Propioniciclava sp. TaxID=2038686 RepID=UPI0039E2B142
MAEAITGRALLLDMDGTLVNSHAVVERVWRDWSIENGLDPVEVLPRIHGRQAHATMAILLPGRPHELNLADNARLLAIEQTDLDGIVPIPGAADLLDAIADVPHALATSAPVPLARARMGAAGLPVPSVTVTAEDVRFSKPDPECFLLAASRLGAAPEDCVVFEDSEAGIAAARAAGMAVVGVGGPAAACDPDLAVPDLTSIHLEVVSDGSFVLTLV